MHAQTMNDPSFSVSLSSLALLISATVTLLSAVVVVVALACLWFTHSGLAGPQDIPTSMIPVGAVGGAICVTFSVITLGLRFGYPTGTWTFDAIGVQFAPHHGKPKAIRWKLVEKVKLTQPFVILIGEARSITIPWGSFDIETKCAIEQRLHDALGDSFVLNQEVTSPESSGGSVQQRLLLLTSACGLIVFVCVSIGGALYLVTSPERSMRVAGWILFTTGLAAMIPAFLSVPRVRWLQRKQQHHNS